VNTGLTQYLKAMGIDRWTERSSDPLAAAVTPAAKATERSDNTETGRSGGTDQTFHILNFQSLAMVVGVDQNELEALPGGLQGLCYDIARAYNLAPSRPVISVLGVARNHEQVDFTDTLRQRISELPRLVILVMDGRSGIAKHANKALDLVNSQNGYSLHIDNVVEFQNSAAVKRKFWEDLTFIRLNPDGS
jgi:hypothetical protein